MSSPAARRGKTLASTITACVLMLGGASVAYATDEPPVTEDTTAQVETTPSEPATTDPVEEVAPEPAAADPVVADSPAVADVNPEPAVEDPPPDQPAAPVEDVAPAPEPVVEAAPVDKKPKKEISSGTVTVTPATCEVPIHIFETKPDGGKVGDGIAGAVITVTDKNNGTFKTAIGQPLKTGTFPNGGMPGGLAFGYITISIDDADPNDGYLVTHWENVVLTVDPSTLECNVYPEIPDPKVETSPWQDQEWTCDDTAVTQTRTVTTTPYMVIEGEDGYEVVEDTENITVVTETQTRPLTEEEIENCTPPVTPEPRVDIVVKDVKAPVCGDTSVTQTRTTTTTPFKVVLVDGVYKIVEDTENVKVVTETITRGLTEEEVDACKTPPTTPPVTPPAATPSPTTTTAPPVVVNNPKPPSATPKGLLASTGFDGAQALGLGVALMAIGATALLIAKRRRQDGTENTL